MSSWTTPPTFSGASPLAAADLNTLSTDLTWLKDSLTYINQTTDTTFGALKSAPYGCVLQRTALQTISDATDTAVSFPTGSVTERLDTNSFHDGGSNTARITIPSGGDGWYMVGAYVRFETNTTGQRRLWLEINGQAGAGTLFGEVSNNGNASVQVWLNVTAPYLAAAGDYFASGVRQTSGGNLDVQTGDGSALFYAVRLFAV